MKTGTIKSLIRNTTQEIKPELTCCGGRPAENQDACCKSDEDKKAAGDPGCGCNTDATATGSACC